MIPIICRVTTRSILILILIEIVRSEIATTASITNAPPTNTTCNVTSGNIDDGVIDPDCENTTVNASCNIKCNEGFYVNGTGTAICKDDNPDGGIWNVDGNCIRVTCDNTTGNVRNGELNSTCVETDFEGKCNVICDEGYYVNGTGTAVCKDTEEDCDSNAVGIWNVSGSSCVVYMILDVMPLTSGVKGMDVNMTLQVQSEAPNGAVTIEVTIISSPLNKTNGRNLTRGTSSNGIITYYVILTNLTEEDDGEYTFQSVSASAQSNIYPNISSTASQNLSVEVIPEDFKFFVNGTSVESEIVYVMGNPNNTVKCVAYGKPDPTYNWTLAGNIVAEQKLLFLGNSYFSDNGTYVCNAINNVSLRYQEYPNDDIYIGIQGIPIITTPSDFPPMSDNYNLKCSIDANPAPGVVSWRNDREHYDFQSNEFISESGITHVDDGEYYQFQKELNLYSQLCMGNQTIECSSSNIIGESESSVKYNINQGVYYLHLPSQSYMAGSGPADNVPKAEADAACNNSSGNLVYVTDETVKEFLNSTFHYEFYIGAVNNSDGKWTWGENGDYLSPENYPSGEGNCAIFTQSRFQAVSCSDSYRYVCQIPATGFPKNVTATTEQCKPSNLQISWIAADDRFQTTKYRVIIINTNSSDSSIYKNETTDMTNSTITLQYIDAKSDTEYLVEVYSGIDVCLPRYTPMVTTRATTGFGVPLSVQNLEMQPEDDRQVCVVSWEYSETYLWQINSFEVNITANDAQTKEKVDTFQCDPGIEMTCSFKMAPNTAYKATIRAKSACNEYGVPASPSSKCTSTASPPDNLILGNSPIGNETRSIDAQQGIDVEVPGQNQRNGKISCLFLVLTSDNSEAASNNRQPGNFSSELNDGEYLVYTTDDTSVGFNFTIGNDTRTSQCSPISPTRKKRETYSTDPVKAQNKNLEPSKYYRYYIMSSTGINSTHYVVQSSNFSEIFITNAIPTTESYGWVAGIVVPIFLIIVAIICFLYYRRRREQRKESDSQIAIAMPNFPRDSGHDNDVQRVPQRNRISVKDLQELYENKHRDDDRLLREDFKEIQNCASQLKNKFENAKYYRGLNRYVNILPSNDASVLLASTTMENPQGYINASYIDGYNRPNKFIATQGPKPNTINDFWKMVWEQKTEAIVMLTNVDENGRRKCEKYWPERGETLVYGDLDVTGGSVSDCGPVLIRQFTIKQRRYDSQEREVYQYHYIAWPDHGVPVTTSDLFNLRRMVELRLQHAEDHPIVVHCSAGVGRTGTYIALDCLMDDSASTSTIDVTSQVWAMRERRTEMVQTSDQYVLLYKMILEFHLLKETDDDVANLETAMRNNILSDHLLATELEKAGKIRPMETEKIIGSRPDNMQFNRDRSTIPYDRNLVAMRMRPEESSTPYLNASWIQGYAREDKFIATQDPMPGTEELFWRMVLDNNVKSIIMIKKRGKTKDIMGQYWADRHSMEFGKVTVSVLDNFPERNFSMRKIFVKEVVLTSTRSATITHFEFKSWPEDASDGVDAILELISRVQKEKFATDGGNGPVVVHCSNGSERVGTYCAITSIVERIKMENRVDVMRVVKDLRDMRPGMVVSLDEYKLCYAGVQAYLSSFETYSNFR